MEAAWKRVKSNRGSAGVDGLSIAETADYLKALAPDSGILTGWQLPARAGAPRPDPEAWRGARAGDSDGDGSADPASPAASLAAQIDPTFSEHSYGFRPGRRAHDAVLEAQRYVQDGYRVVVDVDLEKFFDRVNHDILMARLARRIDDKAVLRLIRRYLVAGIMDGGVVMERYEGTPQGGRCRRCWPMCCSTRWIGNWSDGVTASCAMPTTATCMCAVAARANGCWRACEALRATPPEGQ
jgi:hypothetical protein